MVEMYFNGECGEKLGINVGFKVGIGCNFFMDSGHFELLLNCLTIYFIL